MRKKNQVTEKQTGNQFTHKFTHYFLYLEKSRYCFFFFLSKEAEDMKRVPEIN